MIALLQRVTGASVTVEGRTVARIGSGLLALIGIEKDDDEQVAGTLAKKMVTYRLFDDDQGRMNRDLLQTGGQLLLVPQFTLAAQTHRGRRPGFQTAAPPEAARRLFVLLHGACEALLEQPVATGIFGAQMQVALVNDGPVTFLLRSGKPAVAGLADV